ncbi:hypothetical protein TSOC_006670 [Tetrabaena socialis]|uniref:Sulfotransferase n=1 Tax=Tetrabaena socialis TaxID=47790 RepID=A0A2J8A310_9CHLO|nr:hypothetical protein TSOC_006670 [Tetrabaena socialis]|eukprot:PNH06912.1 hypothetical protein TSOC_006670 [Tetrabaena socialis]
MSGRQAPGWVVCFSLSPVRCGPGGSKNEASESTRRSASAAGEDELRSLDYWERLVGTPSKLALASEKKGVLPQWKYSKRQFSVLPFQMTSIKEMELGLDPDTLWRDFTVITSSRNPWARAASGFEYTHSIWKKKDAMCALPTFLQFCRNPFIMGTLANLFNCYGQKPECDEAGGDGQEGRDVDAESGSAWRSHAFFHVEPAANCLVDEAGRMVADFVIRYEHLEADTAAAIDLLNARRPPGLPPIARPDTIAWRKKGRSATLSGVGSSAAAAIVHAHHYRRCGAETLTNQGRRAAPYLYDRSKNEASESTRRSASAAEEDELRSLDYWERLVGTPSKLALASEKKGVLPQWKYSKQFSVLPFQVEHGFDPDTMWRDFTVITSSRNPWARAASGFEFTHSTWTKPDATCALPTFLEFCRNPFIMGALDNLFNCYGQKPECDEAGGDGQEGRDVDAESGSAWRSHAFFHVEPAANCLVDEAGRMVADFVIRYEHLEADTAAAIDLLNARRPPGLPPIARPDTIAWRKKGRSATLSGVGSSAAAAIVHAHHYRRCGAECVRALGQFYAADLELFGWAAPEEAPAGGASGEAK